MARDDLPTKVLDRAVDFGDRYVDADGWVVPVSDLYPDGVKYSFQYGNAAGETIIRYDNAPDHHEVGHHHKHTPDGDVVAVEFAGLADHWQRFKTEVNEHGDQL